MALKLYGTSIALPAPFVAGSCDPVDVRLVAENFSDITTNAGDTFGTVGEYCKVYEGIQVYVSAEKTTYMYVGPAVEGSGILLTEVQKTENWRKISDSESSADKVSETLDDLQTQITKAKVKNTDGSITVGAEEVDGTPISVKLKADNNALKLDAENGLYVDESVLTKYTGSNAISVTGDEPNKVINLVINSSDKVLTQSGGGLLANINLTWDSTDGLKLIGKDATEIATIPAKDFIKDGMLENVELKQASVEAPIDKKTEGTFLVFTFNTDAGSKVINLDVTSLIDVYTAGNGIEVTGKVISVKRDGSSEAFLSIGADGIKLSGVQNAITTAQQTVQNAIDKVESSVGLGTDGTFTAPVSATYVNDATSVMNAITQLDTQAKANADAIANETARAEGAEEDLQEAIDAVKNAAISVVSGNGISVTGSGTAKTITAVAKADDPVIEVTTEGIKIKDEAVWDCGEY